MSVKYTLYRSHKRKLNIEMTDCCFYSRRARFKVDQGADEINYYYIHIYFRQKIHFRLCMFRSIYKKDRVIKVHYSHLRDCVCVCGT